MFKFILKWFDFNPYDSGLKAYIKSKHPKSVCDIEKLTYEFNYKLFKGQ